MQEKNARELCTACEVLYLVFLALKRHDYLIGKYHFLSYLQFSLTMKHVSRVIWCMSNNESIDMCRNDLDYLMNIINFRSAATYYISDNIKFCDLYIQSVADELLRLSNLIIKYEKRMYTKRNRRKVTILLELIHSLPRTMFINRVSGSYRFGDYNDIVKFEKKMAEHYCISFW